MMLFYGSGVMTLYFDFIVVGKFAIEPCSTTGGLVKRLVH